VATGRRIGRIVRARLSALLAGPRSPVDGETPSPEDEPAPADPRLGECLAILELRSGCTREELAAAYRRLCKRYHPDRQRPERAAAANELLAEINAAYDYLRRRVG